MKLFRVTEGGTSVYVGVPDELVSEEEAMHKSNPKLNGSRTWIENLVWSVFLVGVELENNCGPGLAEYGREVQQCLDELGELRDGWLPRNDSLLIEDAGIEVPDPE